MAGVFVAAVIILFLIPQLEYVTSRGPGLVVDQHGIKVARWVV